MTPAEKALAFLERHNMWLRILLKADDRDPRSRDALRELQELFPEGEPHERAKCLTCKRLCLVYYNREHDNFYSRCCRRGMGNEYWCRHKPELPKLHVPQDQSPTAAEVATGERVASEIDRDLIAGVIKNNAAALAALAPNDGPSTWPYPPGHRGNGPATLEPHPAITLAIEALVREGYTVTPPDQHGSVKVKP